jgi:hypothetical protein
MGMGLVLLQNVLCPARKVRGLLLQGERARDVKLTTHFQLVLNGGILGAIPPLSHIFYGVVLN